MFLASCDTKPEKPLLLGAWTPNVPWNTAAFDDITSITQHRLNIIHWYQGWGAPDAPWDVSVVLSVSRRGYLPMITWEPWDYTQGIDQPEYRLSNIAAGNFDAYIRGWAQGAKAYGEPIYLRFAHEMNYSNYPWSAGVNGNTAEDYIAAWHHVHTIFQEEGAINAVWVWSPGVSYQGTTALSLLYPGDDYVDILALDGYNGGTELPWGGWKSLEEIFWPSYLEVAGMSAKPIMIAETASVEAGGSKAQWIREAITAIRYRFPRIVALVWFNENREADWRLNSSPASLEAFLEVAALTGGSW